MKIILATTNQGKVKELIKLLEDSNLEVLTLKDFPEIPEVIEDGNTFEENALKKAKTIFNLTGLITIADDSGLEVDYLNGQPGIYSARFAGEDCITENNNKKLLEMLINVPYEKRTAQFKCVIAIVGNNITKTFDGTCKGIILESSRGSNGFGYDPLFFYEPEQKTFAELSSDIKNTISHRANAFKQLKDNWSSLVYY
jgi:XTP/dITP diphosphohydrolase